MKKIKFEFKWAYIAIIAILLLLLKCSHDSKQKVKADLYLSNYNLEAMKDTVKTYETKNGELISEKTSIVSELKDLEKYNDTLYKRIKYLEKETDSKAITYVKWKTRVVHDTVYIDNSVEKIDSNKYLVHFSHDTIYNPGNERHLKGKLFITVGEDKIEVGEFTIDKDEMILDAEIVISEKDDKLIASVISSHPGFNVEDIEPVVLDPKLHPELKNLNKKRFTIGPYVGVGLGTDLKLNPQIGIGLSYKIIGF